MSHSKTVERRNRPFNEESIEELDFKSVIARTVGYSSKIGAQRTRLFLEQNRQVFLAGLVDI